MHVLNSLMFVHDFTFTFHFHALEKETATHSSVLAWRIPGTGELGGLPSMGSHRVGHNWSDLAATAKYNLFFQVSNSPAHLMFNTGSVQFSGSVVSDSLQPHGLQHTRPPSPSPIPWVYSNSCPSSRWCHPIISSSVIPFSSCLQIFPASRYFLKSVFRIRWPNYWEFQLQHQSFQWIFRTDFL